MHRLFFHFLFVGSWIGWCGSASLVAQGLGAGADDAAAATVPAAAEQVAVDDVVEDQAIEQRLAEILKSTEWFEDVEVRVENGVVFLDGSADSEEHRLWAADVAGRTQDVVATVNKLQVPAGVDLQGSAGVIEESLRQLSRDFLARSPLLIAAVLMIVVTAFAAKFFSWLLSRVLNRRRIRTGLKDLLQQLAVIAVWIAGLLIASVIAFPGMTPSKALTVLGLGSIAIGFAFKDIFENFFAGILILWRYPFDRGDFITTGEITGCVQEITIRNTMIRRLDGELSVVPNAQLFTNSVDVLTSQTHRRVRLICGVAYGEDVDVARETITAAVRRCDTVDGNRSIEVFANEFADSSVNFEVAWWTGSRPSEIRRSRDQVLSAIKRSLDEAEIEIPFPYRTLTFKDPDLVSSLLTARPAAAAEDSD